MLGPADRPSEGYERDATFQSDGRNGSRRPGNLQGQAVVSSTERTAKCP